MSSLPTFELGQPVFLALGAADDEPGVRAVVEAVQGGRLTVAAAEGDRLDVVFAERRPAYLSYLTPAGIYTIEAIVARAGASTVALDLPTDAGRIQRRQFVRVELPLDASCLMLDGWANRFTPFDAQVADVGGGGLALTVDVIAPYGAVVVVSLGIPDEPPVVAVGTVLTSDRDPARRTRRLLRLQFSAIAEADRDRLIKWIFAHLRRIAKENR
ncbi:MAG: PilZ domain-containing protein [Acidimicrobiia bacterium]